MDISSRYHLRFVLYVPFLYSRSFHCYFRFTFLFFRLVFFKVYQEKFVLKCQSIAQESTCVIGSFFKYRIPKFKCCCYFHFCCIPSVLLYI